MPGGNRARCAAPPGCVPTAIGSTNQRETLRHPTGADITARVPEIVSTWFVDWSILAVMGETMPPRNPNDDDDEDEDEDGAAEDDEPAVIREPDE
jgi:hypothetical protein